MGCRLATEATNEIAYINEMALGDNRMTTKSRKANKQRRAGISSARRIVA